MVKEIQIQGNDYIIYAGENIYNGQQLCDFCKENSLLQKSMIVNKSQIRKIAGKKAEVDFDVEIIKDDTLKITPTDKYTLVKIGTILVLRKLNEEDKYQLSKIIIGKMGASSFVYDPVYDKQFYVDLNILNTSSNIIEVDTTKRI